MSHSDACNKLGTDGLGKLTIEIEITTHADELRKQAELLKEVAASFQRLADFLNNTRYMIIVGKREGGRI